MNFKAIRYYLGNILFIEAGFMLPALLLSLFKNEMASVKGFAITIAVMCALAPLLVFINSKGNRTIFARDGLVIVSLSWIVMSIFGAMPFVISGYVPSFIDALFETVSGFTTTGATILTDIECLPYGLLYWRSFTNWLGGMGVLVFLMIIVPNGDRGSGRMFHLLKAESPGPVVGKLAPKLHRSAVILYAIYLGLTVLEIILLLCGGMPVFDAITNTFGTAGTGGFCIKNQSIGFYQSDYLQMVIGVFMMLFGVNFTVYYLLLLRQFRQVAKNEEVKYYFGILFAATLAITFNILPMYAGFGQALRDSFFQVSSIMTTTGFTTADFNKWPEFSRILLVLLMVVGASAGSTGGGIKVARLVILLKSLRSNVERMLHPRSVRSVKLDGNTLDDEVVRNTTGFMTVYLLIIAVSVIIISFDNFSAETTVTSVFACINNIGPGLDLVGPVGNFSIFGDVSKIVLSLNMLVGRLEIFPILMLFLPQTWKKN